VISAVAEYFDICGDKISHCDLVAKTYGHVEGGSRFLGNYLHDMTTRQMSSSSCIVQDKVPRNTRLLLK